MDTKRATAELLIATVEAAIARGCRHYSESGELLATLAVLECLQREGFVTVEEPGRLAGELTLLPSVKLMIVPTRLTYPSVQISATSSLCGRAGGVSA
jgi:hypothetical protein